MRFRLLSVCALAALLVAARPAGAAGFNDLESQVKKFTLPNGLTFLVLERHDAPVFSFRTYVDAGGRQRGARASPASPTCSSTWRSRGRETVGTTDYRGREEGPRRGGCRLGRPVRRARQGGRSRLHQAAAARGCVQEGAGRRPQVRREQRLLQDRRGERRGRSQRLHHDGRAPSTIYSLPIQPARAVGPHGGGPPDPPGAARVLHRARRRAGGAPLPGVEPDRPALQHLVDRELPGATLRQRADRPSLRSQADHPPRRPDLLRQVLRRVERHDRGGGGREASPRSSAWPTSTSPKCSTGPKPPPGAHGGAAARRGDPRHGGGRRAADRLVGYQIPGVFAIPIGRPTSSSPTSLGSGRSSRIYERLVKQDKIAAQAGGGYRLPRREVPEPPRRSGHRVQGRHTPTRSRRLSIEELDGFAKDGPTAEELAQGEDHAAEASFIRALRSNSGLAGELAQYQGMQGRLSQALPLSRSPGRGDRGRCPASGRGAFRRGNRVRRRLQEAGLVRSRVTRLTAKARFGNDG